MTEPAVPGLRPARARHKVRRERSDLDAVLDATMLGHLAFVTADGHPVVLPTAVARDGDRVLLHGSTGSPWMRRVSEGVPVSLAVTTLDALVVARSAFESSLHYRSAVLFGRCAPAPDAEHALDVLTEALIPGRVAEVRRPSVRELRATLVLQLPITDWSVKVSDGWPEDEPEDVAGSAWAGVVPLTTSRGTPVPAPNLRDGIGLPASLR